MVREAVALAGGLDEIVKDGQVEKVSQSPFFNTYRHLAYGESLEFWWIEWGKYWKAGGAANKSIRIKDFLKWGSFELTLLPAWQNLTVHQRQTRFRKGVRELEQMYAERRRDENRTVIGVSRLFDIDPRDHPKTPGGSTPQPLCHTVDKQLRREYKRHWFEFVKEHRKASWDFRNGYWEREFPDGAFRPPILTIYLASRL
jgi:hypothetical protein